MFVCYGDSVLVAPCTTKSTRWELLRRNRLPGTAVDEELDTVGWLESLTALVDDAEAGCGKLSTPRLVHLEYALAEHAFALDGHGQVRSEERTSELQSLMRMSDAVFCL